MALMGYHYTNLLYVLEVLHDVIDIPQTLTSFSALNGARENNGFYGVTIYNSPRLTKHINPCSILTYVVGLYAEVYYKLSVMNSLHKYFGNVYQYAIYFYYIFVTKFTNALKGALKGAKNL